MINLVWSGLLTLLLLSGCGFDGTPTRTSTDFLQLTSIEITAVSPTIAPGTSTLLKVNGFYSGLPAPKDITDQAVWSSGSPAVAEFITALNPNRVTGHIPGDAVLTATVGGVSATYALKVSNSTITSLAITPATVSVPNGRKTQFTATGTFLDGTTQNLITQDVTFDATWGSTPGTFATVSNDPASKGLAKSLAEGVETITATFGSLPSPATATLTVTPAAVESIAITAANTSVLSISKVTNNFTATGTFSDGTTQNITNQVAWTSSNPNIATITTAGDSVTTLAQGTVSISATPLASLPSGPGVSGAANLKVTGGNLNSFTVSPGGVFTLVKGTARQLSVIGTFDNGAQRDITGMAVWSSITALATVTPAGGNLAWLNAVDVTPVGNPTTVTATVTTSSGSKTATIGLAVIDPTLIANGLQISPASRDLTVGTSSRFTVSATFNDGTIQDVTYSSDWTSTGTVSVGNVGLEKGRVRGVSAGTAAIRATFGGSGGQFIEIPVTVTARTLQNLTISNISALFPGRQVNFTATANYTDTTSKVVTEDTTWSVDKSNVAIFPDSTNQPGQMVAVDSGSATVTASFVGATPLTITITVPLVP